MASASTQSANNLGGHHFSPHSSAKTKEKSTNFRKNVHSDEEVYDHYVKSNGKTFTVNNTKYLNNYH